MDTQQDEATFSSTWSESTQLFVRAMLLRFNDMKENSALGSLEQERITVLIVDAKC